MIPIIISGLILVKKRMMIEMVPPPVRKFWKEWELVGAAVLSLTLQIVLIITGNRRKYIHGTWFRVIVWCAYIMADYVATMALGILSNDLGDVYNERDHINMDTDALIYDDRGHMNVGTKAYINEGTKLKLKAFWAPFFLLHLGGPDTITAYSLQDNELFLRHLSGLIVQTITALYIMLLAWTSSHISYLSIAVIVVGCIKYGERTMSLWKASWNKLQNTILTYPNEGLSETTKNEDSNLVKAHALFQTFKSLFADTILSSNDRVISQALFKKLTHANAFNLIEIELGFMYDLLYTKAPVIYTSWGFAQRFITFSFTCFAFLSFILDDKLRHQRKNTDFVVTSLLLVVAILLEIYAALVVLTSDETRTWLIKHGKTSTAQSSNSFLKQWFKCCCSKKRGKKEWFEWFKVKRWSNSMAQYSLLWLSLKEKHSIRLIEEFRYKKYEKFTEEYKKLIFVHVKDKVEKQIPQEGAGSTSTVDTTPQLGEGSTSRVDTASQLGVGSTSKVDTAPQPGEGSTGRVDTAPQPGKESTGRVDTAIKELCSQRGKGIIEKYQKQKSEVKIEWSILEWSISVEFDQSILIWHMATEICYYSVIPPKGLSDEVKLSREFSLHMSRYMLYLLVICPFMLPVGIGFIRFRDTCAEAMEFFKEQMFTSRDKGNTNRDEGTTSRDEGSVRALLKLLGKKCCSSNVVDVEERRKKACELLLEVRTDVPPIKVKGDRSKSVLFDACRLASTLDTISGSNPEVKWNLMRDMWLELLGYAACHCRGNDHARQLGQGGELLTHVWLLMAHFGLTEQF